MIVFWYHISINHINFDNIFIVPSIKVIKNVFTWVIICTIDIFYIVYVSVSFLVFIDHILASHFSCFRNVLFSCPKTFIPKRILFFHVLCIGTVFFDMKDTAFHWWIRFVFIFFRKEQYKKCIVVYLNHTVVIKLLLYYANFPTLSIFHYVFTV